MSDINLNISIKEENNILFKRCVRKLLESTFIVGEKEEKLFSFIARESNKQDISDYLRMIGFDVLVDTNIKIAMLKPYEADEETVGLKRANVVTFSTEQYHILLVLWEIYLENLEHNYTNEVLKGDLIDKLKAYEIDADKKGLAIALKLFKKYSLIDYDSKDNSEDAIITLYPSLQFGWDLAQFKTVTEEYIKKDSDEESETEDGEEEEDE